MSASFVQKATKTKRKEKKHFTFSNNDAKVQPEREKKQIKVYVAPDHGPWLCLTLARAKY